MNGWLIAFLSLMALPGLWVMTHSLFDASKTHYHQLVGGHHLRLSPTWIISLSVAQFFLLILFFCFLGDVATQSMGIDRAPIVHALLARSWTVIDWVEWEFPTAFSVGLAAGALYLFIFYTIGSWIMDNHFRDILHERRFGLGLWGRLLGESVHEELIVRWGMMNALLWCFYQMHASLEPIVVWTCMGLSAFLWSLSRLPGFRFGGVNFASGQIGAFLFLNTLRGMIFGWVYWETGILSAIVAHICFELVWFVIDWTRQEDDDLGLD